MPDDLKLLIFQVATLEKTTNEIIKDMNYRLNDVENHISQLRNMIALNKEKK